MGDTVATAGLALAEAGAASGRSRVGEILRDIARGGISSLIVGILVGGIGGRLVMRAAALLHPDAAGALTENGNRIGEVTVAGTLGLVVVALVTCAMAGVIWVIVSPWVPGGGGTRALLTAGIAMATGTGALVIGGNPDFVLLAHDPRVVALLMALVGLSGLSMALLDRWLDGRLPHATPGRTGTAALYGVVALLGAVLVLPFVLLVFLTSDEYRMPVRTGHALLVVGACTAAWWVLRIRGRRQAPPALVIAARAALLVAVVLGALTSLPHVARALGAA